MPQGLVMLVGEELGTSLEAAQNCLYPKTLVVASRVVSRACTTPTYPELQIAFVGEHVCCAVSKTLPIGPPICEKFVVTLEGNTILWALA